MLAGNKLKINVYVGFEISLTLIKVDSNSEDSHKVVYFFGLKCTFLLYYITPYIIQFQSTTYLLLSTSRPKFVCTRSPYLAWPWSVAFLMFHNVVRKWEFLSFCEVFASQNQKFWQNVRNSHFLTRSKKSTWSR